MRRRGQYPLANSDFLQSINATKPSPDLSDGERYTYNLTDVQEIIALNGKTLLYAQRDSNSKNMEICSMNVTDGLQQQIMTIPAQNDQSAKCFI